MNFGEFKSGLRINIGDANSKIATDATCLSVINRAITHVYNKLLLYRIYVNRTTISVTLTATSREVTLQLFSATDRIQKVLMVETESGTKLDILEKEKAINNQHPCVYVVSSVAVDTNDRRQNFVLGWYIVPDDTIDLTVTVIPKPKLFSAPADAVIYEDIPIEFHPVVLNYATYLLLASDEDNAQIWKDIYDESFSDMVQSLGIENTADQAVGDEYSEGIY